LSRPLGVAKRPSALSASWKEKKEEFLDYDKHLEKRRHLVKETSRGYFQDYHALRQHEGKTWVAPESLIREDKALYFPDVPGMSLEPQETVHTTSLLEGRISIIAMLSSTRSEVVALVRSFSHLAVDAYLSNPLFRYMQINLQDNPLKDFLVSLFLSSIRKRVPKELQSTF
ncbi:ATPase assembly factor ATP10, partial [Hysterangium stoloniferum]